jgi:hypothetical protein
MSANGTQRKCGDVCDHGESWRVSGLSANAFRTVAHDPNLTVGTGRPAALSGAPAYGPPAGIPMFEMQARLTGLVGP